jgi:hypothetical protein
MRQGPPKTTKLGRTSSKRSYSASNPWPAQSSTSATDVRGVLVGMRDLDLSQVIAHIHGQEPLDLIGKPYPDLQ